MVSVGPTKPPINLCCGTDGEHNPDCDRARIESGSEPEGTNLMIDPTVAVVPINQWVRFGTHIDLLLMVESNGRKSLLSRPAEMTPVPAVDVLDKLAEAAHDAFFEGDLPGNGIERELWRKVAQAVRVAAEPYQHPTPDAFAAANRALEFHRERGDIEASRAYQLAALAEEVLLHLGLIYRRHYQVKSSHQLPESAADLLKDYRDEITQSCCDGGHDCSDDSPHSDFRKAPDFPHVRTLSSREHVADPDVRPPTPVQICATVGHTISRSLKLCVACRRTEDQLMKAMGAVPMNHGGWTFDQGTALEPNLSWRP